MAKEHDKFIYLVQLRLKPECAGYEPTEPWTTHAGFVYYGEVCDYVNNFFSPSKIYQVRLFNLATKKEEPIGINKKKFSPEPSKQSKSIFDYKQLILETTNKLKSTFKEMQNQGYTINCIDVNELIYEISIKTE